MEQGNRYILRDMERFEPITATLESRKFRSEYRVLDMEVTESNRYISQKLKIPIASRIFYFRKLRLVDGVPKSIEKTYILYDKVKGVESADLGKQSFYKTLQEMFGYVTRRSEEEILIVAAGEKEKELLGCRDGELMMMVMPLSRFRLKSICRISCIPSGSSPLMIKGITYKEEPEPFEYFEIVAVSDLYEFRSVTRL